MLSTDTFRQEAYVALGRSWLSGFWLLILVALMWRVHSAAVKLKFRDRSDEIPL